MKQKMFDIWTLHVNILTFLIKFKFYHIFKLSIKILSLILYLNYRINNFIHKYNHNKYPLIHMGFFSVITQCVWNNGTAHAQRNNQILEEV